MITLELHPIGKKLHLPTCLAECNSEQYIKASNIIFRYKTGNLNELQFNKSLLYALLDIKSQKSIPENVEDKINENVILLSEHIQEFFIQENEHQKIRLDFIHNPIPWIKHGIVKLIGINDGFIDEPFGKYIDALEHFLDFNAYQDVESLIKMCEILYTPKSTFLYKRFFDWGKVDFGILYGTYLFFASFQIYLQSAGVEYAGQTYNLKIIFDSEGESTTSGIPSLGLKSTLFSIAETGVFGEMEKVRKTNTWEIFLRLYDLRKKAIDEENAVKNVKK